MRSTPGTATIPVLTLATVANQDMADQPGLVLWPCRMEDLRTEIEAALLTAAAEGPSSQGSQLLEDLEASTRPVDPPSSAAEPPATHEEAAGSDFSPRVSCGSDT